MIGKMLGNRYEILEKLGGGGMAIVYKGRDTFLNRLVTVKVLRPEFTSDEDFIHRFRREAQAVARLSHTNIVSIYDVGQEDIIHYLVMEYVKGDNLKNMIRQKGQLEPDEAVRIAVQVCEALEHAHTNNIVHRDVKPHNILITTEGRAKLTDFGIAMEATAATITRTDTIMGSVHYLSPEQARGETATPRSDIYAIGILLYEMLTGKQPYSGDSPIAVALKHIQETPPAVDEVNPAVPAELVDVVQRAMEKKPEDRYRSADELARRLEMILDDTAQNTVILPLGGLETGLAQTPVHRPAGTNKIAEEEEPEDPGENGIPRSWLWIGLVVLLASVLAGGLYTFWNKPPVGVPSVVGITYGEAQEKLKKCGLGMVVGEEFNEKEKGIVIDQNPGEGEQVKPGSNITVTVSKGPETVEVPNLVNNWQSNAKNVLSQAGLTLGETLSESSEKVQRGKIIKQDPGPKTEAPKGSKVTITVSEGPKLVKMPDLEGKSLNEGIQIIEDQNLVYKEDNVSQEESTEYPRYRIIRQEPEPNREVREGTVVKLVVSEGPGPVEREKTIVINKKKIRDDGRLHLVEIYVEDSTGKNLRYNRKHRAGEKIKVKVSYWGSGTAYIFIDGDEVEKKSLEG